MPLYRCLVCRAEYRDPLDDGTRVFHVCSLRVELSDVIGVPLNEQLAADMRDAGEEIVRRDLPREGARDENTNPRRELGVDVEIVSE